MSWRNVRRAVLKNRLVSDVMFAGLGVLGLVAAVIVGSILGIAVAVAAVVAFSWGARSSYRDLQKFDAKE